MRIMVQNPDRPTKKGLFEKDFEPDNLVAQIAAAWQAKPRVSGFDCIRGAWFSETDNPEADTFRAPLELYADLLGKKIPELTAHGVEILYCKPKIWVQELDGRWLIIRWDYSWYGMIPEDRREPGEIGFLFAYRVNKDTPYIHVPVPASCTVNLVNRDITFHFEGLDLVFKKDEPGWPWVLRSPDDWLAHGLLNHLLTPQVTNPLSMLLGSSDRLVKGAAQQLKERLMEVQKHLPNMPLLQ